MPLPGIDNRVPPPNNASVIGGVDGIRPALGAEAPKIAQADDAKLKELGFKAGGLVKELDMLLFKAAAGSIGGATKESFLQAVENAKLPKKILNGYKKELADFSDKAKVTMQALRRFSGKQIAESLRKDGDGKIVWTGGAAGQAVEDAIKAQSDLSEKMGELLNCAEFRGGLAKLKDRAAASRVFSELEEVKLQCDRRICELTTISLSFAELAHLEKTADESTLGRSALYLAAERSVAMHGNDLALEALKGVVDPVSKALEAMGDDSQSVNLNQIADLSGKVKAMQQALAKAGADGVVELPRTNGSSVVVHVDRTFLTVAAQRLDATAKRLDGFMANMRRETLETMVKKAANLDEFSLFNDELSGPFEEAAEWTFEFMKLMTNFRTACTAFINAPNEVTQRLLIDAGGSLARVALHKRRDILNEIDRLQTPAGQRNMRPPSSEQQRLRIADALKEAALGAREPGVRTTKLDEFLKRMTRMQLFARKLVQEHFELANANAKYNLMLTGAVRNVFDGRAPVTTLIEARVNGADEAFIDPVADDRNLVSAMTLGRGGENTVRLLKYKDGSERVFKPEVAGRIEVEGMPTLMGIAPEMKLANLNVAAMKTAQAFGLEDVIVKTTVGVHDGQYGVFMEKAPGRDAVEFPTAGHPEVGDDELSMEDVRNLKTSDGGTYKSIVGELMRKSSRLQWLDILAGQGDRHGCNFFVRISKKGEVSLKGIDNDAGFSTVRQGVATYLSSKLKLFQDQALELGKRLYPIGQDQQRKVRDAICGDPGVRILRKGGSGGGVFHVDVSKVENPLVFMVMEATFGVKSVNVPEFMDRDVHDRLVAMEGDTAARRSYLEGLERELGRGGPMYLNAVSRLDDAIRLAHKLEKEGKVYSAEDWKKDDVQKFVRSTQPQPKPPEGWPPAEKEQMDDALLHARHRRGGIFTNFFSEV